MQAMQVQNHVWAPAIMTVITAVLNVPINIVLVRYYDFWGAALATSVARTLLLLLLCGKTYSNHSWSFEPSQFYHTIICTYHVLLCVCFVTFQQKSGSCC